MAEFSVAAVFSNHMVLQRDKNVKIFGEGEDGQTVTVEFRGQKAEAVVKDGRWCAVLAPMGASVKRAEKEENPDPYGDLFVGDTMTVCCGGQVRTFADVAVGEVWLAGGQSNMEFELQNCRGGMDFLANDKNPGVRFYYTQKNAYKDAHFYEAEKNSAWSTFDAKRAKCWSAVGYFFAKRIAAELGVVVGVIGCNWGGTSASCWMDRETLLRDAELKSYLDDYEAAVAGKSEEEQIAEYRAYEKYDAEWNARAAVCYAEDPAMSWEEVQRRCGVNQWPGPMCCINPFRPAGLYECMLQRVMPYTLRGFLYYQGESDDHKPKMYERLFREMIAKWREDWEDISLPFLMVQLPMHRYAADPDYKHWCLIREAQMRVFETVKNTGIAVILDKGEFNEIHPKEKEAVGERLALQAMWLVYGLCTKKRAFGPIFREAVPCGRELLVCFDFAEDGFAVRAGKEKAEAGRSGGDAACGAGIVPGGDAICGAGIVPNGNAACGADTASGEDAASGRNFAAAGFELAGADKKFVPAWVSVDENRAGVLRLSAKEVEKPMYARYCWTNYGEVNYFGKNGLPMAPFRTSRKDEEDAGADGTGSRVEIRQVMEL